MEINKTLEMTLAVLVPITAILSLVIAAGLGFLILVEQPESWYHLAIEGILLAAVGARGIIYWREESA